MASVRRPDGAEIHWEATGEGPLVVIANICYSPPESVAGLVTSLSADRTVVTYDLRGTGESTRSGPYDLETDAHDLTAVIDAAGPPAVVVAMGEGCNRAVRAAVWAGDLISHVVTSGSPAFGADAGVRTGLAGSQEVLRALLQLMESDYRAALRTMVKTGDPGLEEDAARARAHAIASYSPQEVSLARMRAWIREQGDIEYARALGDRLLILHHDRNPWFGAGLTDLLREQLPSARFQPVEDGAYARPDLTAAAVRGL